MNTSSVVIKKKFNLSKRRLFEVWSNPELMQRWFYGGTLRENCCTVENQFVTNGGYKIVMHFEDTGDAEMYGKYLEINRYNTIVFTWTNNVVTDTVVKLHFTELSPNTSELKLEHSLFPDEDSRKLHNQGWDYCLANLERAADARLLQDAPELEQS